MSYSRPQRHRSFSNVTAGSDTDSSNWLRISFHSKPVSTVTCDVPGFVVSAAKDGTIEVYDRTLTTTRKKITTSKSAIFDVKYSKRTKKLIVCHGSGEVAFIDTERFDVEHVFDTERCVSSITWSSDALSFATTSLMRSEGVVIYRKEEGSTWDSDCLKMKKFKFDKLCTAIKWISKCCIVLGFSDGTLCTINPEDSTATDFFEVHKRQQVTEILQIGTDLVLTGSKDGTATLTNVATRKVLSRYTSQSGVNSVAVLDDLVFLAGGQSAENVATSKASSGSFDIFIYDRKSATQIGKIESLQLSPINSIDLFKTSTGEIGLVYGCEFGYSQLTMDVPSRTDMINSKLEEYQKKIDNLPVGPKSKRSRKKYRRAIEALGKLK